jgi:four helix bundle protein
MRDEGRKKQTDTDADWKAADGDVVAVADAPRDLGERTREFSLRMIDLCGKLPATVAARTIGRQVLRSGTSVGAHWREARRSRSDAEFISKVECGIQELDETTYWLELLRDSGSAKPEHVNILLSEAGELMSILVTCVRKVKDRRANS